MKTSIDMAIPQAEISSFDEGPNAVDAVLSITKTEHIPLRFGHGGRSPGQIIDDMLKMGEVTKITLDLDKDNF